jgi:hypothetical protein
MAEPFANSQSDFRGGLWSPEAQGRFDDPRYKTGMNECLNGFPVQEGSWSRRPGFLEASSTRDGNPGVLFPLSVNASPSHTLEFTDGHLRIYNGARLVTDDFRQRVVTFTTANPAVITTDTNHGWSTGDRILFKLEGLNAGVSISNFAPILFREFEIIITGAKTFKLYDLTGVSVAGITFNSAIAQLSVARITDLTTPYEFGEWAKVDVVQSTKKAFLLHPSHAPNVLRIEEGSIPFSIDAAEFWDGPYLDPINGIVVTAANKTGVVDITFSYTPWDTDKTYSEGDFVGAPGSQFGWVSLQDLNQGNSPSSSPAWWSKITVLNGFANDGGGITEEDIGRHVRLYSEPPDWVPGVTVGDYAINSNVSFGDGDNRTYYTAITAITGVADADGKTNPNQPGFDATKWAPNPAAARWTWGPIVRARPLEVPILTGHWEVPGFTLVSQCTNHTDSNTAGYYNALAADLKAALTILPATDLNLGGSGSALPIYTTPPTFGFGGGCGIQSFVHANEINGYNVGIPADNASSFVIAQFNNTLFGSNKMYPWQYWGRNAGSTEPPTQPVFVLDEVSTIEGLPGTAFGNLTEGVGLNKLFVGSTAATFASHPGNNGYAGLALNAPSTISSGRVYPVSESEGIELGFAAGGITKSITAKLWASTSEPASQTDGTLLGTKTVKGPILSGAPITVANTANLGTAYSFVWFELIVNVVSADVGNYSTFGGGFDFAVPATFSVAASKMAFFDNVSIPAGTDIGVQLKGDPLLYTGEIKTWRLGRYNGHMPTWPTTGCFHGDRLWLASGKNHGDVSEPLLLTGPVRFTPTEPDGKVTEGNAISFDIISDSENEIQWMKPELNGVLVGTSAKEWLISASQGNIITPISRQVEPVSSFGSADVLPVSTSLTTVFVHKNARALFELMRDAYSGQLVATTMQEFAQSVTVGGVKRLAYQTALTPIVWGYTGKGELVATSYRRDHRVSWQPPTFNGWHHHTHGNPGRKFISIAGNAGTTGVLDSLTVMTQDEAGQCRVEVLTDLMETDDNIFDANFLDGGIVPAAATYNGTTGVKLLGLWPLNNKIVTVFIGGLDCGEHTVVNGIASVDYGSDPDGFFKRRYLEQVAALGQDFGNLAVHIDGLQTVPCVVGYTYASRGQRLRSINSDETGRPDGTGLARQRRVHEAAFLFNNTRGVSMGTDFSTMAACSLRGPDDEELTPTELYSGVFKDTIGDESSYDGMVAWETTRPFPTNVAAVGSFLKVQAD